MSRFSATFFSIFLVPGPVAPAASRGVSPGLREAPRPSADMSRYLAAMSRYVKAGGALRPSEGGPGASKQGFRGRNVKKVLRDIGKKKSPFFT